MLDELRYLFRRTGLGLADRAVTLPIVRWTWTSPLDEELVGTLSEFRPTDRETVIEMMAGRYLLASKLVDTHGLSPFAVEVDHEGWRDDLRGFSWLRHFREARNEDERRFARTLALEWVAREGRFDRETWSPGLCARRVLNWLRHFTILVEGASPEQAAQIVRSLGTQIQSLKLRSALATDPVEALLSAIALVGVALCDERHAAELALRVEQVRRQLSLQIDADGLHRSRSARVQLDLLIELDTIKQGLNRQHQEHADHFAAVLERMHRAFDAVSLGTGEPGYFNGTGQLPHDLVVSVQVQNPARHRQTGAISGYGRLISGESVVLADGGLVPPPAFGREAHASALAFEFSYARDLVVCNCGPAPDELRGSALLFRQGIAHSAPTINAISATDIGKRGPLAGRLRQRGAVGELTADPEDHSLMIRTHGYRRSFGVILERRLTLMSEGKTLVGQDRLSAAGRRRVSGMCAVRFHLAPGSVPEPSPEGDLVKLRLASGAVWTFLWEGAEMRIEDSVRQSAYVGFHRTRQIVLEAEVEDGREVSWIFTLDEE